MRRYHEVQQGECLASICKRHGFSTLESIYHHPDNAELKRLRPNPHILRPGDLVFIPEKELRTAEAGTGQKHVFKLRSPRVYVRVIVRDQDGRPCGRKRYELLAEGATRRGQTDPDGLINERVNAHAELAELTVWLSDDEGDNRFYKWRLRIGHLDPVEEVSGVQARLNNLGFHCGEVDGSVGPKTQASIREFQRAHQLPETGAVDESLRAKLRELHRC